MGVEPLDEADREVDLVRALAEAVALAKQSVDASALPLAEGLVEEGYLFQRTIRLDAAQQRMKRFLEVGGQTREVELSVGDVVGRLDAE